MDYQFLAGILLFQGLSPDVLPDLLAGLGAGTRFYPRGEAVLRKMCIRDRVKISPNAVPPVCKIMDYGKYRFEQTKREKEARKNQRVVEIKEIRMSPSIDLNDFNVKLRNAQKFLSEGNRCKVTVRFRGREMAHTNIGQDLLLKFAEECGELAVMDKRDVYKRQVWRGRAAGPSIRRAACGPGVSMTTARWATAWPMTPSPLGARELGSPRPSRSLTGM